MVRGPPEAGGGSRSLPRRLGWSAAHAGPGARGTPAPERRRPPTWVGKPETLGPKSLPGRTGAPGGRGSLLSPPRLCHACSAAFIAPPPAGRSPDGQSPAARPKPGQAKTAGKEPPAPAGACPAPRPRPRLRAPGAPTAGAQQKPPSG